MSKKLRMFGDRGPMRRAARAGQWVCLTRFPSLQQGMRQLYTMGIVERERASAVLPGYKGSTAWAYRLAQKEGGS